MNKAHLVLGLLGGTALVISVWSVIVRKQEIDLLNKVVDTIKQVGVDVEFSEIVKRIEGKDSQ